MSDDKMISAEEAWKMLSDPEYEVLWDDFLDEFGWREDYVLADVLLWLEC